MPSVMDTLPPKWAEMCRAAGSAHFAWAHNGVNRNGTLELKENGILVTSWCEGTWGVKPGHPDVLEMTFGSSTHVCKLMDGGFTVEDKYLRRSGKCNYKPGAAKSCGWVRKAGEEPKRKAFPAPRDGKAGRKRKESDDEGEADVKPTFSHKELKFEAFAANWRDYRIVRQKTIEDLVAAAVA